MKKFSLTIAGSDPTSGAGIQADIRTFDRCGVHPFSIITAITYQTSTKFYGYKSLSDLLDKQFEAILNSYPIKFVKIGMIPDKKSLNVIVNYIKQFNLYAVYDPVLISSAGERLSEMGLEKEIEKNLFPLVKILTPNLSEAMYYSNVQLTEPNIRNVINLRKAATVILDKLYYNQSDQNEEKAVIIKSALTEKYLIEDLLLINQNTEKGFKKIFKTYKKRKIELNGNIHVHGTGCVFSSAITAFLSKDNDIEKSIELAETFFDEKFQKFVELPDKGKVIDLTTTEERLNVINQIKEVYNFISDIQDFTKLIPEVRSNISGALPNAKDKSDIAGIEGRVTIIDGYPYASGEIKFGASDHTARLILAAKEFDDSINFVINLKYKDEYIKRIQENTKLFIYELNREAQPEEIRNKEQSTMQWLIKESVEYSGKVPDIVWDKGEMGKEAMIRVFGKNSKDLITKLKKIIDVV